MMTSPRDGHIPQDENKYSCRFYRCGVCARRDPELLGGMEENRISLRQVGRSRNAGRGEAEATQAGAIGVASKPVRSRSETGSETRPDAMCTMCCSASWLNMCVRVAVDAGAFTLIRSLAPLSRSSVARRGNHR